MIRRRTLAPVVAGLATLIALTVGHSAFAAAGPAWSRGRPVAIGFVTDDNSEASAAVLAGLQAEIRNLMADEYPPRFSGAWTLEGNSTLAAARKALGALLADPEVDLVICAGYVSSTAACHFGAPLTKPVVAPFALDAGLQGLRPVDGGSGIPNLHYLAVDRIAEIGVDALRQLVPVTNLALLAPPAGSEVNPGYRESARAHLTGIGQLAVVPLGNDADAAVAAIPAGVDAVVAVTDGLPGRRSSGWRRPSRPVACRASPTWGTATSNWDF